MHFFLHSPRLPKAPFNVVVRSILNPTDWRKCGHPAMWVLVEVRHTQCSEFKAWKEVTTGWLALTTGQYDELIAVGKGYVCDKENHICIYDKPASGMREYIKLDSDLKP